MLCGSPEVLGKAFELITQEFARYGLTINKGKCKLFTPTELMDSSVLPDVPRVGAESGIVVLGVPVGSEVFVTSFVEQRLTDLEGMLGRLRQLDSSLTKFLILRACLGACKVTFLLRSLGLQFGKLIASRTKALLKTSLSGILEVDLDEVQFGLASMATVQGGLGLQDPEHVLGPASLGSSFVYATSTDELPELFWRDLSETWAYVRQKYQLPDDLLSGLKEDTEMRRDWTRQSWWQSLVNAQVEKAWSAAAPLRARKLKDLNAARTCCDVSDLLGSEDGEEEALSSHAWRLLMRFKLGDSLGDGNKLCCPGCGEAMDSFGDHVLSCHQLGIYTRHNHLRNKFASLCNDAGLEVRVEKGPDGQQARPGDCLVRGLCAEDRVAVDFTGVHPLQQSCSLAEVQPGKAASRAERTKRQESQALCKRAGWGFYPFAFETVGSFGGGARFLCQRLARQWSLHHECSLQEAGRAVHRALGCAVIRAVARQLERGFPAKEQGSGANAPAHLMSL